MTIQGTNSIPHPSEVQLLYSLDMVHSRQSETTLQSLGKIRSSYAPDWSQSDITTLPSNEYPFCQKTPLDKTSKLHSGFRFYFTLLISGFLIKILKLINRFYNSIKYSDILSPAFIKCPIIMWMPITTPKACLTYLKGKIGLLNWTWLFSQRCKLL